MSKENIVLGGESVSSKIYTIRGKQVMLDRDLANLYQVQTKALNQAVKRNRARFPEDFMFQLTQDEAIYWMSQFVTSNKERMGVRKMPYVFTQEGVSMLSGVLHSPTAIKVNIEIMRAFVQLRSLVLFDNSLADKIELLEHKFGDHDRKFAAVFEALRELLKKAKETVPQKGPIGFHVRKNK